MSDNDRMTDVLKPQPYVRGGIATGPRPLEREALLPGLNDPYKAAGSPDAHEVGRLVVVMGRSGFAPGGTAYQVLQYVHLGFGEFGFEGDGQWFRFLFADRHPKLLSVHGRGLMRIFDMISLRRLPWVRVSDRDFRGGGGQDTEPIITRLEVTDWVRLER